MRHHPVPPEHPPPAPPEDGKLPLALLGWAILAMGVDIGLARFTCGVTLPAIRRDLGFGYTVAGALGSLHLFGYLAGTLAAPAAALRVGHPALARGGHLLFAAGAALAAFATGRRGRLIRPRADYVGP